MVHILSLTAVLSITWWLLSGYFLGLLMSLGAVSIVLVVWIVHRMDAVDDEVHPIRIVTSMLVYFPWLIWEIIKANFDVAYAILFDGNRLEKRLILVNSTQKSEIGQVILANSITLTPGTVTIGVDGNSITVHSLTKFARSGLETGVMDERVTALETDAFYQSTLK